MAKKIRRGPAFPKRSPGNYQPWPQATRPHYIRLFDLSERLRASLMVGAELAEARWLEEYERQLLSPRGTLRRIYLFLREAQKEVRKIEAVYESGRPPQWYKITVRLGDLIEDITTKKLPLVESGLGEQDAAGVIKETAGALKIAHDIRNLLLSLPLADSEIAPDPDTGLETITDLSGCHILDLRTWQLIKPTPR